MFRGKRKSAKTATAPTISLERGVPNLADILTSDGIEINKTDFIQGGKFGRVLYLATYCRQTYLGWLEEIFGLGDMDMSVQVEPIPDRMVIDLLSKKVTILQAQYITDRGKGNIYSLPALEQAIRDLEGLREAIYTNQDRMYYLTTTFTLYADTKDELEFKTKNLKDILARRSSLARTLMFVQDDGLKTTLPFGHNRLTLARNATMGGVVSMMPFANHEFSHSQGTLMGINYFTGGLVFYDPFMGPPELSNPHLMCCGWSGSGKTVYISTKALRSTLRLERNVLIDPEEGHIARWVRKMGGTVIEIDSFREPLMNLFEIDVEEDPDYGPRINLLDKVAEIRSILGLIVEKSSGQKLTAEERVAIEEGIREVYAMKGITTDAKSLYTESSDEFIRVSKRKKELPTISMFKQVLENKPGTERLSLLITPMLRGNSLGMFDGQSKLEIEDALLVCFDIHNIKDEFTRLYVMAVLLSWIWQKYTLKNPKIKKHVYFDEGWMFAKHEDTAEYLETLARRARKYKTGLNIASQSFIEFVAHDQGKAILGSCATTVLFKPHPAQIEAIQEMYHLSSGVVEFLGQCETGCGIILSDRNLVAIYNRLLPFEQELFFGEGG